MSTSADTIFHVDMDALLVPVGEVFDPSLKGDLVVVGGQRDELGVVFARFVCLFNRFGTSLISVP